MTTTHVFAGLAVADYGAAYAWYARLFGRSADMFPQDSEAVWRLSSSCSIYVVHDPKRAGRGIVTLAIDDLDANEGRLREAGIAFDVQAEGSTPRRLVVEDGDGNMLTLFPRPGAVRYVSRGGASICHAGRDGGLRLEKRRSLLAVTCSP